MYATNYIKNWSDVVGHVIACYPEEACGVITAENVFIPCMNEAEDKKASFAIDPSVLLEHDVKCILHSHTYDPNVPLELDPRIPSAADLQGQIDTDLEWAVVVCEGENVSQPFFWGDYDHRPPLMEREFIHCVQDCLVFVTDWLYKECGFRMPMYSREWDWNEKGKNHFEELFEEFGFEDVSHLPEQRGDLLFYKIRCDVVNHIGVVVAPGMTAHHLAGRFPVVEPSTKWAKYITKRIRLREQFRP